MRAYSLTELFCMTRAELFALHARIAAELPLLPEFDRAVAADNLRKIRCALAHPTLAPP